MAFSDKQSKVVVVEGHHDLAALRRIYPDIDVVITNGSEISDTTLNELKQLNEARGLILFLDPDGQGERIRRRIVDHVGPCDHAFLAKSDCISKNGRKIGVEHASRQAIIAALSDIWEETETSSLRWTTGDLHQLGLLGKTDSKQRRKILCEQLGIGLANGKTLCHKLNMFNVPKQTVVDLLKE